MKNTSLLISTFIIALSFNGLPVQGATPKIPPPRTPDTGNQKVIVDSSLSTNLKSENNYDLNEGLIAWYPFDGNARDISGNGFDGTINGARLAKDRDGQADEAYYFDGTDDYIEIDHDPKFNQLPLSISSWFKQDDLDHNRSVFSVSKFNYIDRGSISIDGWCLLSHRNRVGSFAKTIFDNTSPLSENTWHHALMTISENQHCLYLNGAQIHSKNFNIEPSAFTNDSSIRIGGFTYFWMGRDKEESHYFKGSIDDVRIYDRALSEEEVLALYELESTDPNDGRPTPPPTPGTGELTPPDPDYKDTIAELKKLLVEKDKKLAYCEKEIETLNDNVSGLEKQVASLTTDNEVLKGQVKNLQEENHNISYELTITNEHLEKAIHAAETPFINGWVYDPGLGWLFTGADHFPLVYTHKDETWHYYELGSSNPRYFFNYKTQEWVAWDPILRENEQVIVKK